jgi:hypothetical protein
LVAQEKQARLQERQRRLESEVGPLWALADAWRKAEGLRPGVYVSVHEQAALTRRAPTLDELEQFAAREYSFELDVAS